jgi:membrane protein CcdC involved in cytochrome C biogenesis
MSIIITILVGLALFILFIKAHSRHKHPAKVAIVNMIFGVLSLAIVAPFVQASVNVYAVFTALTLGVPGAVAVAVVSLL